MAGPSRPRARAALAVLVVLAVLASACGDAGQSSTTASPAASTVPETPNTTTDSTTSPTTVPDEPEPRAFDPVLAEELIALEAANDGQWTPDTAIAAYDAILPAIRAGADGPPPIGLHRLFYYLVENFDSFSEDQRSQIQALAAGGANAVQASLLFDESDAPTYQRFADEAASLFTARTGYSFPGVIKVVTPDVDYFDFGAAGAYTNGANFAAVEGAIGEDAVDELNALVATEPGLLCVIIFGNRFRGRTPDRQVAGVMHEVTHCHQHAIHPGGPDAFMAQRAQWMDEGYALWAGEITAGGSGTFDSKQWWDLYHRGRSADGGYGTLAGSYDGIALFSYLHDSGADGWAGFARYFGELRANSVPDALKFSAMFDSIPEDAQAGWAAGSLQRPALSDLWTYTTGPGVNRSNAVRQPAREVLRPDDTVGPYSVPTGDQATVRVLLDLAGEEAALLTVSIQGPGAVHWPWDEDELSTNSSPLNATWCIGPECRCDDGSELGPPAPEFTESNEIIAALNSGAGFTAKLAKIEDECEEEEPIGSGFGACPGGQWTANPEDTAQLLQTLYAEAGIPVPTYEGGSIILSFFEDGTYRFDYDELTFSAVVDGTPATFILNKGNFGTWEAADGELTVEITGFDQELTLQVAGVQQTFDAPPNTGGGTAPYRCAGDQLFIDFEISPLWPFPGEWSRVDT